MGKEKVHMSLVVIGHVDAGKSTATGHLIYKCGGIDKRTIEKFEKEAAEMGKSSFKYAWVLDKLKAERERGITIDIALWKFESPKSVFTIIDAPGHRDFIKNMITGASQADAAVLVVSGNPGDGVQAQTKEHVFLAKTQGVGQLIILVNKMDLGKYAESRFKEVKEQVSALLKSVGFKTDTINFVPVASLHGENIVKKSTNMPWYAGPTLIESLDLLKLPEKPTNLPLRLPLQDVYNITGIGVVTVGRVETGIMKVGDKVTIVPGREGKGVSGDVKTIEAHHEQLQSAEPGDNVGFVVRGVGKTDIAKGDVLGHSNNATTVATEFTARIIIINHPTVVTVGYTPVFHIHTDQKACQFVELVSKLNPATGEVLQEKPDFLKNGDAAIVRIKPIQPLVIEKQSDIPQLARFAIRDSGSTVAAGMCIDLVKKTL